MPESGLFPVFFRYQEGGFPEGFVIRKAACRRMGFPEDGRSVLGYLDQFRCNDCIEPDQVFEHFLRLVICHTIPFHLHLVKAGAVRGHSLACWGVVLHNP